MTTITLPNGTVITTDTPEEAAQVVKALDGAWLPPGYDRQFRAADAMWCTCNAHGTWMSILPPPQCPVHGGSALTVTCGP